MAFRVKDLLINIAPGDGNGPNGPDWPCWETAFCTWSTTTHPTTLAAAPFIACPGTTVMGPAGGGMPGDPSASRNEFDAIRQRLRQVLKEVEEQEHQPLGPQAPQTLAEVDKLQEKLREALSELDRRKTELTKEK